MLIDVVELHVIRAYSEVFIIMDAMIPPKKIDIFYIYALIQLYVEHCGSISLCVPERKSEKQRWQVDISLN